ncbi:DNA cytosine methyltransferase [Sphingobacterium multivorum]|uniref:DNA cytosine methyltransferase n=1 Tax=Sphingobacterium multivorum TaxID=28454 RepID=UPI00191AD50E|nr:DNA cytosine methyltransferase [Sphingobacterium multivorum]QQT62630.1 DNA cytosine methyltransferase [Sphingobacterium multivorum]
MKAEKPTYIDLFAGCGGLSLGLHNAGWKGLFAIEKNPDAFETLSHNLMNVKQHFDWPEWLPQKNLDINNAIREFKDELTSLQGKVDLIAGGPPCQGFSMAGRRNENDERNDLIKSYIKFIRLIKPKIIFFENVKGFTLEFKKNKEKGKRYSTYVKNALNRAGYHVHGELVNFAEYGVPQKRTRFILVGIRKDLIMSSKNGAKYFFSAIRDNKHSFLKLKNLKTETTIGDAISDLLRANGTKVSSESNKFKMGIYADAKSSYQSLMRYGVSKDVADSHRFPNHNEEIIRKFEVILGTCKKNKDIDAEIRKRFNIKKHTIIPLDKDAASPTITTLPDDYIHYCEPRILTVREYARIQSFPDWYEFQGKYTTGGKRRTKEVPRYSQIGNAIPPLFGEQSGIILKQFLSK